MEIKTYDKLNSVTESANTNGNKDSNAMVNAVYAGAGVNKQRIIYTANTLIKTLHI